jgi:mitochondrial fission protein ELM1
VVAVISDGKAGLLNQSLGLAEAMELPRVKVSGKDSLLAFRLRLRTGRRGV